MGGGGASGAVSVILLVPVELLPVIRDDCLVVHSNMVSALGSYN